MKECVLCLWQCGWCGLRLWTWEAATRAERVGCPNPHCAGRRGR